MKELDGFVGRSAAGSALPPQFCAHISKTKAVTALVSAETKIAKNINAPAE